VTPGVMLPGRDLTRDVVGGTVGQEEASRIRELDCARCWPKRQANRMAKWRQQENLGTERGTGGAELVLMLPQQGNSSGVVGGAVGQEEASRRWKLGCALKRQADTMRKW
jgi:hypothetical protein